MTTQPRGPRPPITRETPGTVDEQGGGVASSPETIEAHGAILITGDADGQAFIAEPEYTGTFRKCRKPFKLNGKRYAIGEDVPIDLIPRSESWVRTGFLQEAS